MEPLASQLRPKTLDEFVGQAHLVGNEKPIRNAVEKQHIFSFILWGPPGVGKTTLAHIYANALGADFHKLSAVAAGKNDVREIVTFSNERPDTPTVLFLDEIHRFNKAQQDFLLPHVEDGTLVLVGATTENPSFEVISPLLSRCKVFTLESLSDEEMSMIIDRTNFSLSDDAREWVIRFADGDARRAISALEETDTLYDEITPETLAEAVQERQIQYDKKGEEHYNTISAFIKSMRASQPDTAVYYLARMIEAGEDPKFIARRMVIFASEDIGVAQPTAVVVANDAFRAVETVGLPECEINLAAATVYLAQAKKDRSAYNAYRKAQQDVTHYGTLPIPKKVRNAPTDFMKKQGYGKGYEMYSDESFLPEKIKNKRYLNDS